MCAPSARRSSASRWPSSRSAPTFGGTCLNVGCIPSKALLHASELYEEAQHGFGRMGIGVEPTLDLGRMLAFKDEGVKGNVDGVAYLLKKNKIETVLGTGRIAAPGVVDVALADGGTTQLQTKAIVIATGSDVARLSGIDIDEQQVVSSTGALSLPEVPKRMLVVGAGVIGLELGSVWRRLGSKSPWSSSWIAYCRAWTARLRRPSSACSRSRAWRSSSARR